METSDRRKLDLEKFKRVKPRELSLDAAALVRSGGLAPGQELPLVFEPTAAGVVLADWAAANRELLDRELLRHGALLFRGFGIDSPAAFESFATVVCPGLFNDNGEHPRESVSGNVYTPVFFPNHQKLLWHNENSFNQRWPRRILFGCQEPAEQGGETPIVDSRRVFARLDPELRAEFLARGVGYQRTYYGSGLGLSWQQVFRTEDRAQVERRCAEDRMELEWRDDGTLSTVARRPAAIRHPVSGEASWFNQAQHWHLSCLDAETRASLRALYPEEQLPRSCRYGDGSPIADAAMAHVLEVYGELEIAFPWQRGDVLLLDNILTAHARNPFAGKRKLLVALGQMTRFDEVEAVRAAG
jgi:alpha-ketoglutarate-dependent taurine dioxygenase